MMNRIHIAITCLVVLALATAGCAGPQEQAQMTFAEAKAQAAERGVPLLIDFYTDW